MAGNQAVVEFLLKWSESGGQLPEKVKRDLDRMGQSSNQAVSITDRLGQAFTRLERREPQMFMRQFRGTIDGLAQSALGATGPLGRLAASFVGLLPGGAITLGATGGLAAIALEIKSVIDWTNSLEGAFRKLDTAVASFAGNMGSVGKLVNFQEIETPQPGLLTRLAGRIGALFGQTDIQDSFNQLDFATQRANDQIRQMLHDAIQEEHSLQERLRLEAQIRDAEQRQREFQRQVLEETKKEAARWEAHISALAHEAAPRAAFTTVRRTPITLRGGPPRLAQPLTQSGEPAVLAAENAAAPEDQTAAILSAILGFAGSARGGVGGALSGLGGLASVALRTTPIVGQVLSFGGGLLSLFSSGHARVSISRLEQEALEQMRQVQQVPQYLSQNIVTNDLRGTKNRLARLENLDTVTRGVT